MWVSRVVTICNIYSIFSLYHIFGFLNVMYCILHFMFLRVISHISFIIKHTVYRSIVYVYSLSLSLYIYKYTYIVCSMLFVIPHILCFKMSYLSTSLSLSLAIPIYKYTHTHTYKRATRKARVCMRQLFICACSNPCVSLHTYITRMFINVEACMYMCVQRQPGRPDKHAGIHAYKAHKRNQRGIRA